jgi:hypothetical protein
MTGMRAGAAKHPTGTTDRPVAHLPSLLFHPLFDPLPGIALGSGVMPGERSVMDIFEDLGGCALIAAVALIGLLLIVVVIVVLLTGALPDFGA